MISAPMEWHEGYLDGLSGRGCARAASEQYWAGWVEGSAKYESDAGERRRQAHLIILRNLILAASCATAITIIIFAYGIYHDQTLQIHHLPSRNPIGARFSGQKV